MEELRARVAVVTGAASGIGYALAERFLAEGMKVVLADIEEPALARARAQLDPEGARTLALRTDVSVWEDVAALADATYGAFGAAHVLCNNAGVAGAPGGPPGIWNRDLRRWQWILGVNLWGVIHGTHAFLPRMLDRGEDGHVVNTASVAGIVPANSIYSVTKHAVVAFSEAVHLQLAAAKTKVGCSVLCPGLVKTNILDAARNRPPHLRYEDAAQPSAIGDRRQGLEGALDPSDVAAAVVDGIRARRFYVLAMQDGWEEGVANAVRRRADSIIGREDPRA
jgi:NAD(P)-dependent dehydrogenase (short-subunit alcohol dehydrogenase family)